MAEVLRTYLHKRALSTMRCHTFQDMRLAELWCLEDMASWLFGLCCAGGFLWLQSTQTKRHWPLPQCTDSK